MRPDFDDRNAVELSPRVWWVGSMLPGASAVEFWANARAIAERIRSTVATDPTAGPAVTVSIGVAVRHGGEDYHGLVARADHALYEAKTACQDRIDVAA